MTVQPSSESAPKDVDAEPDDDEGDLIRVIDESGEGFQFTPSSVAKPLGIACLLLFGTGCAAGVPLGMAMGWGDSDHEKKKKGTRVRIPDAKAQASGFAFALKAFAYGTLLCGALGIVGVYGIHRYFKVDSIQEFGEEMRVIVPRKRKTMEAYFEPGLKSIRSSAQQNLPAPLAGLQARFNRSVFGRWAKKNVQSVSEPREVDGQLATTNSEGLSHIERVTEER